jgi:hypothetical protein
VRRTTRLLQLRGPSIAALRRLHAAERQSFGRHALINCLLSRLEPHVTTLAPTMSQQAYLVEPFQIQRSSPQRWRRSSEARWHPHRVPLAHQRAPRLEAQAASAARLGEMSAPQLSVGGPCAENVCCCSIIGVMPTHHRQGTIHAAGRVCKKLEWSSSVSGNMVEDARRHTRLAPPC